MPPVKALGFIFQEPAGDRIAEAAARKAWELECAEAKKNNKPCSAYKDIGTIQREQIANAARFTARTTVTAANTAAKSLFNFFFSHAKPSSSSSVSEGLKGRCLKCEAGDH
jgi:invasion protein IalB